MSALTAARVREVLAYNAVAGSFTWVVATAHGRINNRIAGYKRSNGYVRIKLDGKLYYAHRLAWLWTYGHWPLAEIDHINGDPSDNRIANLREATRAENCQNITTPKHGTSGLIGAHFDSQRSRWFSQISVGGKNNHLGYFNTAQEAHEAYKAAKRKLHAFQPETRSECRLGS